MDHFDLILAQLLLGQAEEAPAGGILQLAPFALMAVVMYLLLLRPASKQRKEHQKLLNSLKKGDEISLSGGIYGKIAVIDDEVATVEIANNVKIKVFRDRIAGRWPQKQTSAKTDTKSREDKSPSTETGA